MSGAEGNGTSVVGRGGSGCGKELSGVLEPGVPGTDDPTGFPVLGSVVKPLGSGPSGSDGRG